jgi:hypothetical protein
MADHEHHQHSDWPDEGEIYEQETPTVTDVEGDEEDQSTMEPGELICTDRELEEAGFSVGVLQEMPEVDHEFVSEAVAHGDDICALLDAHSDGRDLSTVSARTSRALGAVAEWWGVEEFPALLGLLSDIGATPLGCTAGLAVS